jgi:glycolate dehydrogenase FAD-binding subunit
MSAAGYGDVAEVSRVLLDRGAAALSDDAAARGALAIGGVVPALVATPVDPTEVAGVVAAVAAASGALVPLGRGAHGALGHPPARYDVALSTTRLARVRDYTPADMTVTVEAGTTIAELQGLLATEGQWLPVDPPLPDATTVGGLIAADLGGPLRASAGRVRDLLIGIAVVGADGKAARAGGKVVKNVAGYDLMKLFTGSLGTLAVVTEATFKVRPRPAVERCVALAAADLAAAIALADGIAASGVDPLTATVVLEHAEMAEAVDAPCKGGGGDRPPVAVERAATAEASSAPGARAAPVRPSPLVVVTLAGIAEDVAVARTRLLDLARGAGADATLDVGADDPRARAVSAAVRDAVRAAPGDVVVRATTLPRRAGALARAAAPLLDGAAGRLQLDPRSGRVTLAVTAPDPVQTLAALAALTIAHGAHLVVERWPVALAATVEVWRPLPAAFPLMRRMKDALDPARTLAPGRFVGRL